MSTKGAPAAFAFSIPGAISAGTPAVITIAFAPPVTAVLIAESQPLGFPFPETTWPFQPIAFAAAATPAAECSGSGAGTLKIETTDFPAGTEPGETVGPVNFVSGCLAAATSARAFARVSFGPAAELVAATAGMTASPNIATPTPASNPVRSFARFPIDR